MGKFVNLEGRTFKRLTVIERAEDYVSPKGHRVIQWLCKCECGNAIITVGSSLRRGATTSCGCFHKEKLLEMTRTHGHAEKGLSPTYVSYQSMIARCTNQKLDIFYMYGGRGIAVCIRWLESFENFLADMGERPEGTSLDRVDVDSSYTPENCRWASRSMQSYNQRRRYDNTSGRTGVNFVKRTGKWQARISVDNKRIFLGLFSVYEDAVVAREAAELRYFNCTKI